jgi:demethylmenaquinone methyltransferase/2-methoxy-6-polyprenyl-1,4-benzoquinol methylase
MFDRIAPRYDFLNRLLSGRQDVRWRRFMCKKLPVHRASSPHALALLDLACGTGDVLQETLRSRPDYGQLVGFDLSAQMLSKAATRFAGQKELVSLVHGTATRLPFETASFDAVTIAFGFRNIDDRSLALKEMARVLRPGGRIFVLEFFPLERSLLGLAFEFYFRRILPLIGGIFSDREAYQYLPDSVESMPTYPAFCQSLVSSGLVASRNWSWLFGGCRLVELAHSPQMCENAPS